MRVVVTGALGHIGSRLIRELPAASPGVEIVMVDNLSTHRHASLFHLPNTGRYEFVEADILDADLHRLFERADAVFHLAALTNASRSVENPDQVELVNFSGTEKVARACVATDCALLFPSTTSVYGARDGHVTEECVASDLQPQSPYADWKLRSEGLLNSLGQTDGLRFVIFRMGSVFGPSAGMRFHTAVNRFCWQAATAQPVEVWRTAPHQYRPYLDLTDAVRAMLFVLQRRTFDGRVYNVVTLNATVAQVLEVVSEFVPDLQIMYVDSPIMNQLSYRVDNIRFAALGFDFAGTLRRGVGDTLQLLTGVGTPGRVAQSWL